MRRKENKAKTIAAWLQKTSEVSGTFDVHKTHINSRTRMQNECIVSE